MDEHDAPPATSPTGKADEPPTIEEHSQTKKTPAWALACAKAFHGWGIGQRMSAADFDKAVSAAINHPAG